jgi:hypothetical protein
MLGMLLLEYLKDYVQGSLETGKKIYTGNELGR